MARRRVRPTLLLQAIVLIASVVLFVAIAILALRDAPIWMLAVVLVGWVVAIELQVLPAVLERWVLRQAAGGRGVLRSRIFTYDAGADDARQRERRQADVDGNPSLW
jgi:hypothetical protein